jgi:hypothetical protein
MDIQTLAVAVLRDLTVARTCRLTLLLFSYTGGVINAMTCVETYRPVPLKRERETPKG